MDEDFEIEIQGEENIENPQAQLPVNFLRFGEIESDDVRIYIRQDVFKRLEKYSRADTEHERGTILLGDYIEDFGKMYVIISDYIEARNTDASASTLTFTHETWDYVYEEQKKNFPDKKIVGWQHTHPNYGIFLSNYDMFIQENFFNLPFQTAYVIDPIQNLRGFFQWKNGKVQKLHGYYVYDETSRPIKIEQMKSVKSTDTGNGASKKMVAAAVLILLVSLAAFGSGLYMLNGKILKQKETVDTLQTVLSQTQQRTDALEKLETVLDDQGKMLQEHDKAVQRMEEEQAVPKVTEPEEKITDQKYIRYVVKNGDTMFKICESHGLDFFECIYTICRENQIEDPSIIYNGQVIWLPVSENPDYK